MIVLYCDTVIVSYLFKMTLPVTAERFSPHLISAMHGRLKVKTTAQQEAEKKKERAVKLAGYRHAMAAILARRRDGQQDEEQLQLTAQVTQQY